METLIPDATQKETQLTLMNSRRAFWLMILTIILSVIFCFISFIPPSTISNTQNMETVLSAMPSLAAHVRFDGFSSMSSLALFGMDVKIIPSVVYREIAINIVGTAITTNSHLADLYSLNISDSIVYKIPAGVNHLDTTQILAFSSIDFSTIVISLEIKVMTGLPILLSGTIEAIYVGQSLTTAGVICIAIVTVLVAIMLVGLVSRRVRPAALDQWMAVILSGILFIVDGPWLLLQYYAVPAFAQVFDVMPQLFHAFFIIFTFAFFSVRTKGATKKFYKHWLIYFCIIIFCIVTLVLQFIVTDLRPIATFPIYRNDSKIMFAVYGVVELVYHLFIVVAFLYGFLKLKISKIWTLTLVIFMFCSLEAVQIAAVFIRCFISSSFLGASVAIDIFYIMEANLITFMILYVDTPVSRLSDASHEMKLDNL